MTAVLTPEGRTLVDGLRPYPEYRGSGIQWLDSIPAHWRTLPMKRAVTNPVERGGADSLPFVALEHIESASGRLVPGFEWEEVPAEQYATFRPGDVLFGKLRPYLRKYLLVDRVGCCPTELLVLRADPGVYLPEFLFYAVQAEPFVAAANSMAYGVKMPRTSWEKLAPRHAWVPPIREQKAIIAYCRRETERVDAVVEKKQRLIGLLEERRTSLISRAVTRGLDPEAPLKDSGVPWLGLVPTHWHVQRLKYAARLESGHTPNRGVPEYWVDCTIPWVSLNDCRYLKEHIYLSETANYINEAGIANSSARLLPPGTVVLSRDATIGRCGILAREMATSQHFVNWVCGPALLPEYLLYVLRAPMQQYFNSLTNGATIATIGMPDVNQFAVPVPPIGEQSAIVDYIGITHSAPPMRSGASICEKITRSS